MTEQEPPELGAYDGTPFRAARKDPLLQRAVPVAGELSSYGGGKARGDLIAGLTVAGLLVLQAVGAAYVQATIDRASATYGLFAAVIGLLSWLWLVAQLLLISAEINAVRAERLWPRSLGGPLTTADRRALERAAAMAQTDLRERIAVTFDEP